MSQFSLPASAEPKPYTCCQECYAYDAYGSRQSLRPLPRNAGRLNDPDGIDWNNYYWGNTLDERRTIIRPLPRSITDRTPLEVCTHILDMLEGESPMNLYNCALVCQAWYHHTRLLLYSHIRILDSTSLCALVRYRYRNPSSKASLANTRRLHVSCLEMDYNRSINRWMLSVPSALGTSMPSLRCLVYEYTFLSVCHPSFPMSFSCFPSLVHLTLRGCQFKSSHDLRTMICALKSLRELQLERGTLLSKGLIFAPNKQFLSLKGPRLERVRLSACDGTLYTQMTHWMATSKIFHTCVDLQLEGDSMHRPARGRPLQQTGSIPYPP